MTRYNSGSGALLSRLFLLACLVPSALLCAAQEDTVKGTRFDSTLSWNQVLSLARQEHKFIFIDCYATWCGPCKTMDQDVYPTTEVGQFANSHFISLKVQLDSTKSDPPYIRENYALAKMLQKKYKVEVLPTFLFFSSEGDIVDKGTGLKKPADFVSLMQEALDPDRQFYTLVRIFQAGQLPFSAMPALIKRAGSLHETAVSLQVARKYICDSLANLPDSLLLDQGNVNMIFQSRNGLRSTDHVFEKFYAMPARIDTVMGFPGYAETFVTTVIYNEMIQPALDSLGDGQGQPDWAGMEGRIRSKYNPYYATASITDAELTWYRDKMIWDKFCECLVRKVELEATWHIEANLSNSVFLNNSAWAVFQFSHKPEDLQKAIQWADQALAMTSVKNLALVDTKANLLYKLGRRKEALALETALVQGDGKKVQIFQKTLAKMENGENTWPQ